MRVTFRARAVLAVLGGLGVPGGCVKTDPLSFDRDFGLVSTPPTSDLGPTDDGALGVGGVSSDSGPGPGPDGQGGRDALAAAPDVGAADAANPPPADAASRPPDAAGSGCEVGNGTTETCNGLDDDCDERLDEGTLNACGACGSPPAEECNGRDDDCDGRNDEGVANACGGCGAPPAEVCDGEDDDCDRVIDEGFPAACANCPAPSSEVCNGADDDCDQRIDEQVLNVCGGCGPVPDEACNGADDDCDGRSDEGALNACLRCGPVPEESCNRLDDDCDGGVDEGACQLFALRPGEAAWAAFDLRTPGNPWADGRVVDEVIGLTGRDALLAFAGDRLYFLQVSDMTWVLNVPRTQFFPELGDAAVVAAYDVPRWWPPGGPGAATDTIYVHTATELLLYTLAPEDQTTIFDRREPALTVAGAPAAEVGSAFMDLLNRRGSWPGDPRDACDGDDGIPNFAGPVLVALHAGRLAVSDVGYCFRPLADLALTDWSLLGLPGAPDPAQAGPIAALAYMAEPDDGPGAGYYIWVNP